MTRRKISIMACGWLGLPLAQHLLQEGHRVKGSTSSQSKIELLSSCGIEAYQLKLEDESTWDDSFFESEILIINIPPSKGGGNQHPNLIEKIAQKASLLGIQKVLFISSTSVYPSCNTWVDEDYSPLVSSGQGALLVQTENILRAQKNIQTTVVRFAGLMGPQRHPGRFFGGKTGVAGANVPVNFIALEDCIGIISNIINKNAWGEVFNGAAPHHPNKTEFYNIGAKALGLELPQFDPSKALEEHKIIDGNKVTKLLKYNYQVSNVLNYLNQLA